MRLDLGVDGRTITVEVGHQSETIDARVGDHPVEARATWLDRDSLLLRVGDRTHDVEVTPLGGDRVEVHVGSHSVVVDYLDAGVASRAGAGRGSGAGEVTAPMPGKVLALLVAEGDEVAAGQGVAVVEAMKMENELAAPIAGVVRAINCAAGDVVDGGDVLVELG